MTLTNQKKRSWLFLRGLGRCSEHWDQFRAEFIRRCPGDEFQFIDTAGNGTQVDKNSFLSISEYVEDLRERCSLSKNFPLNIVSISMGSMMALDWAQRHPQEISSLVLMNTSDRSRAHFYERLQIQNWQKLLRYMSLRNTLEQEKLILQMTAAGLPQAQEIALRFSQLPITHKSNLIRQIFAASRYQMPKEKPPIPILVLSAQKDQFVDPVCSQRIALAWQLPHQIHPKAGHDLPLWDPQWTVDQILKFHLNLSRDR